MALMSSLRDKTKIILYTIVIAIVAVVIFGWVKNKDVTGIIGSSQNLAGQVNGESISLTQYDEVYKAVIEDSRRQNPAAELTPEAELGMQEQAWNTVVDQTLLEQQFKKFNIDVQDQEVVEAFSSATPPMVIRQNFSDPATGLIDREKLASARRDPKNRELWLQIEKIVRQELKVNKLIRALQTLVHVTEPELGDIVNRQFSLFSASFVPVPLSFAGAESQFSVKDDEIKKYYDEHKELFKQVPSRKADYVFFPLTPSSKDSIAVRNELAAIRGDFASSANDADFVQKQSDRPTGINVAYTRADFSPAAAAALFNGASLQSGAIVGPIADRGEYRLLKVKQVTSAAQPVARASHILLRFNPASQDDVQRVRQLTGLIGQQLQAGVPFEALAKKYSADPGSAANGGDVGWFSKERMVPEFSAAVFSARPGAIVGPVQTQLGLHIIKVTGFDQTAMLCSEVVRTIRASSETVESERRLATAFQLNAKEKGFDTSAASEKLRVEKTGEFGKRTQIERIGYSDKIAAYAFKAGEGDLSDVIETEKGFYVMRLTSKNDSGYRSLDAELKKMITAELIREKRGAVVEQKLAAMVKTKGMTLESVAAKVGSQVVNAENIRWSDGLIPGYGADGVFVEALSGLTPNKLSSPIKTSNGYALALLNAKTLAPGVDLAAQKAGIAPQLLRAKQEQLFSEYFAALRKNSKIEDNRP